MSKLHHVYNWVRSPIRGVAEVTDDGQAVACMYVTRDQCNGYVEGKLVAYGNDYDEVKGEVEAYLASQGHVPSKTARLN